MSRHKTDPIVMERVRQIIYDTGMTNKELSEALGLHVNTIGSSGCQGGRRFPWRGYAGCVSIPALTRHGCWG